jgi:hypothetical protein
MISLRCESICGPTGVQLGTSVNGHVRRLSLLRIVTIANVALFVSCLDDNLTICPKRIVSVAQIRTSVVHKHTKLRGTMFILRLTHSSGSTQRTNHNENTLIRPNRVIYTFSVHVLHVHTKPYCSRRCALRCPCTYRQPQYSSDSVLLLSNVTNQLCIESNLARLHATDLNHAESQNAHFSSNLAIRFKT